MQFLDELKKVADTLKKNQVEFIVIGGFAVNFHGYARATNDLDIWLKPTTENFILFISAVESLDYDVDELRSIVFDPAKTFIRIPFRNLFIDFMTKIPGGINFSDAIRKSRDVQVDDVLLKVISYEHLLQNKKATDRPKDVNDVIELEKRRSKN